MPSPTTWLARRLDAVGKRWDATAKKGREFRHGQWIYAVHVAALFAPGRKLPLHPADQLKPQSISTWTPAELRLLIEEGRRQSDRQKADLDELRGRAQWLFTVAVAALGALGAGLAHTRPGALASVFWAAALLGLAYGVGGATAIMVARADFRVIHAAVLSGLSPPVERELAEAYAGMMAEGENTVATRITVFRQAVVLCLCGGYLGLLVALASG